MIHTFVSHDMKINLKEQSEIESSLVPERRQEYPNVTQQASSICTRTL